MFFPDGYLLFLQEQIKGIIIITIIQIGIGVFGGEEEGGGVRSWPGAARTILLLHIISARPSNYKQPLIVSTFLKDRVKVYMELGSY